MKQKAVFPHTILRKSYEYWKATLVRGRNSIAFIFFLLWGGYAIWSLPSFKWVFIYLNRMHFSLHLELITKLVEGKSDISCSVRLATNVKNQVHCGNLSVCGNPLMPTKLDPSFCSGLCTKVNLTWENFLENIILNSISHHSLSSNCDPFSTALIFPQGFTN